MSLAVGARPVRAVRAGVRWRAVVAAVVGVLVVVWGWVRPLVLFVASMACFVVAAGLVAAPLGWATAGLVLLVAEWRASE